MTPFVEFLAAIAVCAIIWYGGVSVIDGVMTTGELIAFLIYAINLANPTRRVAESVGNIQKSLAAADRVLPSLMSSRKYRISRTQSSSLLREAE